MNVVRRYYYISLCDKLLQCTIHIYSIFRMKQHALYRSQIQICLIAGIFSKNKMLSFKYIFHTSYWSLSNELQNKIDRFYIFSTKCLYSYVYCSYKTINFIFVTQRLFFQLLHIQNIIRFIRSFHHYIPLDGNYYLDYISHIHFHKINVQHVLGIVCLLNLSIVLINHIFPIYFNKTNLSLKLV